MKAGVMKASKSKTGSAATHVAARKFSRRLLLKRAAAAAVAACIGPWIVRDAFSSSGNLRIMMWSDLLPDSVSKAFMKATGIKLSQTLYGSDEELLHRVKAFKGQGFDLISPSASYMGQWRELGLLRSFDMNKIPVSRIDKSMLDISGKAGTWDGKTHHLPFVWGFEGLAWRTDKWYKTPESLTYGDLWAPEMKGKIMGSPGSMLTAIGLYLDHAGKIPSNRMLDSYKDEDSMRRIWDKILAFAIQRRSWIKLFWEDAEGQVSGFKHNGVILGQAWNGPVVRMSLGGEPVSHRAPVEGGLAWLAGLSIPSGAENIDQAYEFLKYQYAPKSGALIANKTGYASCVAGFDKYLDGKMAKINKELKQSGVLDRLWWWPSDEPWRAAMAAEYRDKFAAA